MEKEILGKRQVRRTAVIKGKRVKITDDFNYSTGDPILDLYAGVIRQAINDYYKADRNTECWISAKKYIEQSPYADKNLLFMESEVQT